MALTPNIYIAERYVIGQIGFIRHAISDALSKELPADGQRSGASQALEAWTS